MNGKRKIGILLVLIGIGIPLVLFFFQENGEFGYTKDLFVERRLTPTEREELKKQEDKKIDTYKKEFEKQFGSEKELVVIRPDYDHVYSIKVSGLKIPFKPFIGVGMIFLLFGLGLLLFSFSPKQKS